MMNDEMMISCKCPKQAVGHTGREAHTQKGGQEVWEVRKMHKQGAGQTGGTTYRRVGRHRGRHGHSGRIVKGSMHEYLEDGAAVGEKRRTEEVRRQEKGRGENRREEKKRDENRREEKNREERRRELHGKNRQARRRLEAGKQRTQWDTARQTGIQRHDAPRGTAELRRAGRQADG